MFSEHVSGDNCLAAEMRSSTVMVTAPPVVMFTTASVDCLLRGRNCMKTFGSGDGRPSLGSRACRCRMAAPACAAPVAWVASWWGVIGRAADMGGAGRLGRALIGRDRQRVRHGRGVDRPGHCATDDDLIGHELCFPSLPGAN